MMSATDHPGVCVLLVVLTLFATALSSGCCTGARQEPYLPGDGPRGELDTFENPVEVVLFAEPGSDAERLVTPYFEALADHDQLAFRVVDQATEPELSRQHKVRDNGTLLFLSEDRHDDLVLGSRHRLCRRLPVLDEFVVQKLQSVKTPPCPATVIADDSVGIGNLRHLLEIGGYPPSRYPPDPQDQATCLLVVRTSDAARHDSLIADHLREGGAAIVAISPSNTPTETLALLGITLGDSFLRNDRLHVVHEGTPDDELLLITNSFEEHPLMKDLATQPDRTPLLLPDATALEPGERGTVIVRAPAGSWFDGDEDGKPGDDEPSRAFPLGVAVELEGGGRAVVIGSSRALDDDVLQTAVGNAQLVLSSANWLVGPAPVTHLGRFADDDQIDACEKKLSRRAPDPDPILVLDGQGPVTAVSWDGGGIERQQDDRGGFVRVTFEGTEHVGSPAATEWLDDLDGWTASRELDVPPERWADLGLDPATLTLTVEREGVEPEIIQIGEQAYGSKEVLVQSGDRILLARAKRVQDLDRAVPRLISHRLTPLDAGSTEGITAVLNSGEIVTIHTSGHWLAKELARIKVTGPAEAPDGEPVLQLEVDGAGVSWPVSIYLVTTDSSADWIANSAWQRGHVTLRGRQVTDLIEELRGLAEDHVRDGNGT